MKNQDVNFTSLHIPRGMREGRPGHPPGGAKASGEGSESLREKWWESILEPGSSCLSLVGAFNTLSSKPETPSKGDRPGSLLTAHGSESLRLKSFVPRNLFDDVGIWANPREAGGADPMPGTQ